MRISESKLAEMKMSIDELLQKPYWIVDILPMQVRADNPGQYFAVEKYFLAEEQRANIKQKHINLVLKLNCYRDISIDEEVAVNPPPERIADEMRKSYLCILMGNTMIISEPDDTYLTVYNPDMDLLELIKTIATSEGLFVWKPDPLKIQ